MGGEYAACRDAYNTCMDQFCATVNNEFRRCICSERFRDIQSTDAMLLQAMSMLESFGDDILTRVTLTGREATSLITATEGERASERRRDTSAAANELRNIRDVLSGRAVPTTTQTNWSISTVGLFDVSDIWAGSGTDIWASTSGSNVADREGQALFSEVNRMCANMVNDVCGGANSATMQMVRAAYSVLITQDCAAAERRTEERRVSVQNSVRQAERTLWELRLQEYQDRNSASVNECSDRVRTAMMHTSACGPNWRACLDPTGQFVNINTGEPRFGPQFFQLADSIDLYSVNIITSNPDFVRMLNRNRPRVEDALRTCSDNAEFVWNEFLHRALLEISQAQRDRIEEVRNSCVETIAECYTDMDASLEQIDTRGMSGAQRGAALSAMCVSRVSTCAALHCPTSPTEANAAAASPTCEPCQFDNRGNVSNPDRCGLSALLRFVAAVDRVNIQDGCIEAVISHVATACGTAPARPANPTAAQQTAIDLWDTTGCGDSQVKETILRSGLSMYCSGVDTAARNQAEAILFRMYGLGASLSEVCLTQTPPGVWNENTGHCVLDDSWYESRCRNLLNGTWQVGGPCTVNMP
jgi:hypothetical protein